MAKIFRFVTNDLTVRVSAVDATLVVAEMQGILKSYPLASIGVGRAMVGALLMASQLKDGQEVGILLYKPADKPAYEQKLPNAVKPK